MSRILLIMHHIALFTPCIALLLVSHTCAFYDRPHRAESEIQVQQIQRSVVAHKRQVARILTLLWIKASPGASNHIP
jgi:hypothetical protein